MLLPFKPFTFKNAKVRKLEEYVLMWSQFYITYISQCYLYSLETQRAEVMPFIVRVVIIE